jgi:hypothetical protein
MTTGGAASPNDPHSPENPNQRELRRTREDVRKLWTSVRRWYDGLSRRQKALVALAAVVLVGIVVLNVATRRVDLGVSQLGVGVPVSITLSAVQPCPMRLFRVAVMVSNGSTMEIPAGHATVRFEGKPVGGSDADLVVFEEPVSAIQVRQRSTSRFPEVQVAHSFLLPSQFQGRPSTWSATVRHASDQNPSNNSVTGVILEPCR